VDAGLTDKLPALIRAIVGEGLLAPDDAQERTGSIALVVATHPHSDHIRGIRQLLDTFGDRIAEFWDPGYFHTSAGYLEMMAGVEQLPNLLYAQPTSGLRRWIGNVAVTVLSPSIQLKNRFDTYGTEINDSSLSLRLEFPASRVVQRDDERRLVERGRNRSLVLGADAQTLSWSYVLTDFPELHTSDSAAAKAIEAATGADLLRGHVLKISHHGSKHGVNLELVERIGPDVTLISSERGGGRYNFPHTVAQELIREAIESTTSGQLRSADHELGIFYTSDEDDDGRVLGSFAIVISPEGDRRLWRFTDLPDDPVDFARALEWQ
ncbi:MAG: ComEC/Rec2 family competence protein, partial [Longimicrobiales bacterium]